MHATMTDLDLPGLQAAVAQLHADESHVPPQTRMALWRARNRALQRYRGRGQGGAPWFAWRGAVAMGLALALFVSVSLWATGASEPTATGQALAADSCEQCGLERACYL